MTLVDNFHPPLPACLPACVAWKTLPLKGLERARASRPSLSFAYIHTPGHKTTSSSSPNARTRVRRFLLQNRVIQFHEARTFITAKLITTCQIYRAILSDRFISILSPVHRVTQHPPESAAACRRESQPPPLHSRSLCPIVRRFAIQLAARTAIFTRARVKFASPATVTLPMTSTLL